jgi:hypothetical protein
MAEEQDQEALFHRKFAVETFNYVWDLLEKPDRSVEEDDSMLHAAHASRYHWEKIGKPVNLARGEWQVARVYTMLNRPKCALYHARRCLEICEQFDIGDFDLAYAYEALARAYAIDNKFIEYNYYLRMAQQSGEKIAEQEDREHFFEDLNSITIKNLSSSDD